MDKRATDALVFRDVSALLIHDVDAPPAPARAALPAIVQENVTPRPRD